MHKVVRLQSVTDVCQVVASSHEDPCWAPRDIKCSFIAAHAVYSLILSYARSLTL